MAGEQANHHTLKELGAHDVNYQPLCIQYPDLLANFELKSGLIHLLPKFHGLAPLIGLGVRVEKRARVSRNGVLCTTSFNAVSREGMGGELVRGEILDTSGNTMVVWALHSEDVGPEAHTDEVTLDPSLEDTVMGVLGIDPGGLV
ncbi:hypothetical protein K1719_023541 [Acacia pycnantha]|nr:hypothetical protein K1719_023541 [Acacia pycnantha]